MMLLAVVALVALAGVFYGSPYFTMNKIRAATMDEDTQALAAHIDLPQLRGSPGSNCMPCSRRRKWPTTSAPTSSTLCSIPC